MCTVQMLEQVVRRHPEITTSDTKPRVCPILADSGYKCKGNCDIPLVRAYYLSRGFSNGACRNNGTCLPLMRYPQAAMLEKRETLLS